jgi:hypothetical protein
MILLKLDLGSCYTPRDLYLNPRDLYGCQTISSPFSSPINPLSQKNKKEARRI